jgi:tetratricopeptide (TPR) repeat protein
MRKGDFDKALEAFHKAIALDDGNSIVYRNLGNLHFAISERGKNPTAFKTSLDFYRRAIEINPDDPSSYNGMGFALLQGGRPDEALPLFERALALAPGYSSALYNLGLALFESGNPEKALEILVRFKERYGRGLSPAQAGALDDLIGQCRSKIRSGSPRPG